MAGKEGHAIGIDLGTTYSCVAVWEHDRVEIIVNDQGNRTTPSCVAFTETERFVGDSAINQIIRNPTNSIFDAYVQFTCTLIPCVLSCYLSSTCSIFALLHRTSTANDFICYRLMEMSSARLDYKKIYWRIKLKNST
ncbi:unnamed protein product [Malus baccata var. baccata]